MGGSIKGARWACCSPCRFALLFWNEDAPSNAPHPRRGLGNVLSVSATRVDPGHEGPWSTLRTGDHRRAAARSHLGIERTASPSSGRWRCPVVQKEDRQERRSSGGTDRHHPHLQHRWQGSPIDSASFEGPAATRTPASPSKGRAGAPPTSCSGPSPRPRARLRLDEKKPCRSRAGAAAVGGELQPRLKLADGLLLATTRHPKSATGGWLLRVSRRRRVWWPRSAASASSPTMPPPAATSGGDYGTRRAEKSSPPRAPNSRLTWILRLAGFLVLSSASLAAGAAAGGVGRRADLAVWWARGCRWRRCWSPPRWRVTVASPGCSTGRCSASPPRARPAVRSGCSPQPQAALPRRRRSSFAAAAGARELSLADLRRRPRWRLVAGANRLRSPARGDAMQRGDA